MIERVGIIGVGHLAGYLVEGLRRASQDIEITLSPRNAERAASLAARFGAAVATDNQPVADTVMVGQALETLPLDILRALPVIGMQEQNPLVL